jgi:hypothetical protein
MTAAPAATYAISLIAGGAWQMRRIETSTLGQPCRNLNPQEQDFKSSGTAVSSKAPQFCGFYHIGGKNGEQA